MKDKKRPIYKRACFYVWAGVSLVLIALIPTIHVLSHTTFADLLNFAMGGPTNIYAPGSESSYTASFSNKQEALDNAYKVNKSIAEEGMVLLKNENQALPIRTPESKVDKASAKPKISVFGKNSANMAIGGGGSGAATGAFTNLTTKDFTVDNKKVTNVGSLESAGFDVNPTLLAFYQDDTKSGTGRKTSSGDLNSGATQIMSTGETPQSSYTGDITSSYKDYSDAAVVLFTRVGSEGCDCPMTMKGATGARKDDDHYLQLDQNETDLLKAVCEADFKHVIVLINSGSAMELGFLKDPSYYAYQSKIDAALWVGFSGNSGSVAIGEILNGNINPSGRTVDTYVADLKKDPTWNNFSENRVANGDQYVLDSTLKTDSSKSTLYYFADYEESVYVGYRYYETRGYTDGETWYSQAVTYPFGYGLSYTTFTAEISNKADLNDQELSYDKDPTVKVKVTNTGTVAGKQVVELYSKAPYYDGGIEKPYEVLVGFAKTDLLEPGKSQEVTIDYNPYYSASYDYKDKNANGFKGYELEHGTYTLSLNSDAHTVLDSVMMKVTDDQLIDKDPVSGNDVMNQYTDQEEGFNSDAELGSLLSRKDWENTWPQTRTAAEMTMNQKLYDQFTDTSTNNPTDYDSLDYPMMDAEKKLAMRDLLYGTDGKFAGKTAWDDSRWDSLLDQMNFAQVLKMYNGASYKITNVDSVGLPYIGCSDGPVGWTSFVNDLFKGCASYSCGTLVASSWSTAVSKSFGEAVGEEGLIGAKDTPFTGWYAPGMNIHRSAFGGRNFEYYSEDPLLSGKIAAGEIQGTKSKGVVTFIKHFALNEQETHRSISGDASWVTEQAMREIYLRPFEIAVKEGGSTGLMSSFNRIGTRWTGGDYRLLTTILRDEWGFKGAVICDFNTVPAYMNPKQEAYAGGDLNLATLESSFWNADDSSTGDALVLRRALKNVLYAIVNSNAMKGEVIGQNKAPWEKWVLLAEIALGGIVVIYSGLYFTLTFVSIHKAKKQDSQDSDSAGQSSD
ncbi:MAG: glycoside hydrolase family 3 C-terminal domain-containing protein [Bacilli bacterium]|jgi:beta-glucosidase|nr:glycoside hydrolase family 3 C-terminal domain-containing protein [Bacilli bacterium]